MQRIKGDPMFCEMVQQAVAEQMQLAHNHGARPGNDKNKEKGNENFNSNRNSRHLHEPEKLQQIPIRLAGRFNQQIKSPSDTTIYAPGLQRCTPTNAQAGGGLRRTPLSGVM